MHDVLWDSDGLQEDAVEVVVLIFFVIQISKVLLLPLCKDRVLDQLLARRSFLGIDLDHDLEHGVDIRGEVFWDLWEHSLQDLLVETLHVLSLEWRLEGDHLVDDTAQTPHVTLDVVGLILPDLW